MEDGKTGKGGQSKLDMERVGLFMEMDKTTIGDPYKAAIIGGFHSDAMRGKQMLPGGSKTRSTGLQSGYFSEKFGRMFEGESYSDPIKLRRQDRMKEARKILGNKPFYPSSAEKTQCGAGSHYGSIGGPLTAFSAANKTKGRFKSPGRNFYTMPAKRGTGYGYVDVTIGKHNLHQADEYDRIKALRKREMELHRKSIKGSSAFTGSLFPKSYFQENPFRSDVPLGPIKKTNTVVSKDLKPFKPSSPGKKPGGLKAGTFEQYPSHSADSYTIVRRNRSKHVVNDSGRTYLPPNGPKTAPQVSLVDLNVTRSINRNNFIAMSSFF